MTQGARARAGMLHAAAPLAVLLLAFAATCSIPVAAVARASPSTARAKVKIQSDQCTAVQGQTTTECRPGCLVCQAPTGKAGKRGWVLRKRRACVCCIPGRVPHERNPSMCRQCPRGSIAPAEGSRQCDKCPEGFTTPDPPIARTVCSDCLPGRGGPACEKCPAGTWSPGGDSSVPCVQCPAGTLSAPGSRSDKACKRKGTKCPGPNICKSKANSNGTCTNVPGVGIECGCNSGYTWLNGACQETCLRSPCSKIANTDGYCADLYAPPTDLAYECGCNPGYTWLNGACQDENGCAGNPCTVEENSNGTCIDVPAPGSYYTCACKTGYVWTSYDTCEKENTCAAVEYDAVCKTLGYRRGVCVDRPPPQDGFTCECPPGTTLVDGECTDDDGCAGDPCSPAKMPGSTGTCFDMAAPLSGFACGCTTGFWWDGSACKSAAGACVQVIAGITNVGGYSGDGGSATAATFNKPHGVSVDADGNLYIADAYNQAIRKVSAAGVITTLVSERAGYRVTLPENVLAAPNGEVYFTSYRATLHKFNTATSGVSDTVVPSVMRNNGLAYHSGKVYVAGERIVPTTYDMSMDGQVYSFLPDLTDRQDFAAPVPIALGVPRGIAFNSAGDAFVAVGNGILKLMAQPGAAAPQTWTLWNTGSAPAREGDVATNTRLSASAVAFDAAGNTLVAETAESRCVVWLVDAATGKLKRIVGSLDSCGSFIDPTNALNTQLGAFGGIAVDPSGTSLYVAEPANGRILKVKLNCAGA